MKMKIVLASALLLFQTATSVASPAKKNAAPTRGNAQLGTSFRFDGSSLNGKYQNPFGTAAVVENDKFLEDLLGARKHFEDRELKERSQY